MIRILVKSHFFANEMSILAVDLDRINLNDDNNFHEDDLETTHVRLLVWRYKFEKCKIFRKELSQELMTVA